tara:strand:- start:47 stop:454 length:408 start_codon:yes stop_codon:yes gene_type:complete
MPYGKTPMKKKGSMMHMGHDSAMKMGHDSAMKMGHEGSAMKNLNKGYGQQVKSPMKMQGSWMSQHSNSSLHMGHSPMKMESAKQEKKNLFDDMAIDDKASAMQMSYSPMKKYDRVVLGGNKGDKSKTKPGKKDFM